MRVRYIGLTTSEYLGCRLVNNNEYEVKRIERNFKGEVAYYKLVVSGKKTLVAFPNEIEIIDQ